MTDQETDIRFMQQALKEAQAAFDRDEVPVGAVIVSGGLIIARAHNLTEQLTDVTAHAEMQCITAASDYLGSKYLTECTLYVTVEPCVMCAGAANWAQIGRIVFGCRDEKRGYSLLGKAVLHPETVVQEGILEEACRLLMQTFFRQKR
ncbi:MAG TPA: nucleoside deaminase [Bacteroidales bacterium]|nr:nucleoside deaminase [Bacteroidales bacterium]HSA44541.1 nucleoside deaminase [Bacteroidales bacterium]